MVKTIKRFSCNGRHNRIKLYSFQALQMYEDNYDAGLFPRELAQMFPGIKPNPNSIRVLLFRWLKWEYVVRDGTGRYHLTEHGRLYLSDHSKQAGLSVDETQFAIQRFKNGDFH